MRHDGIDSVREDGASGESMMNAERSVVKVNNALFYPLPKANRDR